LTEETDLPPPGRRRPSLSIALWLPAVVGLTVMLVLTAFSSLGVAAPSFPALSGRVVDQAGILPAEIKSEIDAKLAALEDKTKDQFVVVTLASLEGYDIADYGVQLGRAWGVGQKGKNNGLLLIVAPKEHAVRFEVGYGLEGTMTDATSRVIIENAILPRFRANDMAGGIVRGVDDAIQVLSGDAPEIQKLADKQPENTGFLSGFIPFLVIFAVIIILSHIRRHGGWGGPWTSGGSGWSSGSSGGSWSSGSSGGGFSGGGGSFGGGGASGSW
jgi:uncharacterized protein